MVFTRGRIMPEELDELGEELEESNGWSYDGLMGMQKAAILMISLNVDDAALVFQHLEQTEVERLSIAIANTQNVPAHVAGEVLEEYYQMTLAQDYITQGGIEYARSVLESALGLNKASEIIDRIRASLQVKGFSTLKKADSQQLVNFLQKEHPQTISLILSHLMPEQTANVLAEFPEKLRQDVAYRIASLGKISPALLAEVEAVVDSLAETVISQDLSELGGAHAVAEILNKANKNTEKTILEYVERRDPELASEIKSLMFLFEDLTFLDDRGMQRVLRDVDKKDLALALKLADESLKEKFFRNMSERAANLLKEDLEFMGPVRLKEVEEAQRRIVEVVKQLEEDGEIMLQGRGGSEEMVI
jgi:flagellar motor switch protein FliG